MKLKLFLIFYLAISLIGSNLTRRLKTKAKPIYVITEHDFSGVLSLNNLIKELLLVIL
jgi:hypothetical protein